MQKQKGLSIEDVAQNILTDFDFIGITERMDESLVALRFLMRLNATDILFLNSKLSGGYDDGKFNNTCFKIQKPFLSDGVRKFLDSDEWCMMNKGDLFLYESVNEKLDHIIQGIGKGKFGKALYKHTWLLKYVQKLCADEAIYPCSSEGVSQTVEGVDIHVLIG